MNGSTSSHIPALVTAITGFLVAASALLGVLWNRRRQPAEVNLITAQAGLAEETREKTRAEVRKLDAECESLAVGTLEKALTVSTRRIEESEARIKELEAKLEAANKHAGNAELGRERAETQMRAMEGQLERVKLIFKDNGIEWPS